ncbi:MAG: glycosyltransferase family 4 protein [Nitrospirota bacterium]|nr:glycosyltransferase family 4 protein [Nitrospirota bacterium]
MKVLIFNSLYHPHVIGGAENSVRILSEGLKEKGVESAVVSTADADKVEYVSGVKNYYVSSPNLYWMYRAKEQSGYKKPFWHLLDAYNPLIKKKIQNRIEGESPDVIHTNNLAGFSVYVWRIAEQLSIPIVHTIRDYYLLCPKSSMFHKDRNCSSQCLICKCYSVPKKILSNNVEAVIGVSRFVLNMHLDRGYFEKAKEKTHIHNPIDGATKTLGHSSDKDLRFGFVGLLSPDKGIEYLLTEFSEGRFKNTKLFVFGRGVTRTYEEYLVRKFKAENIFFMGYRKTEEIYPLINVLIVPSLWNEPFGRTIPEAYSYGIPVITSDRGGMPEIIDESRTGFVVCADKRGDLEEKLRVFVDNPDLISKFSRNCLELSEKFDRNKIVDEYIRVYRKVQR